MTPGIKPKLAILRKQMRHMLNCRMKARGRPQMGQRLTLRTANLGVRVILIFWQRLDTVFYLLRLTSRGARWASNCAPQLLRNGMPRSVSSSRHSASVFAVVTVVMFMPRMVSIWL